MPHLTCVALMFGCLSLVVAARAQAGAFIIELTNGREMVTSRVWEEGDELKFAVSQGTAGVPKALVKRIRTDDLVRHDQVSRRGLAPSAPEAQASTADGRSATSGPHGAVAHPERSQGTAHQHTHEKGEARLPPGDANAYREQKAKLMSQLDGANKTYLAASGARNPEAKQAALEEMRAHSKQFYALADEVKAKHGGILPAWWND
jgi:hypothetical protein